MENNNEVAPSGMVLLVGIIILSFGILMVNVTENNFIAFFISALGCVFGALVTLGGIYRMVWGDKEEVKMRQEREKRKSVTNEKEAESERKTLEKYNSNVEEYERLYGTLTSSIRIVQYGSPNYTQKYILVYEDSSHIIIKDIVCKFSDIISYELVNNTTVIYSSTESSSKTSTKNMLGRAVVGGVLLGGAGAIVGGATANRHTVTTEQSANTKNDFNIHLTINKISSPNLLIRAWDDENLARNLVALFSVIVERNKSK